MLKSYLICIAILFVVAMGIAGAVAQGTDKPGYMGEAQCKLCHNKPAEGEQWKVWAESAHARAFETLKSEEAATVAREAGIEEPPQEAPECLRCHVTGYDVEKKSNPETLDHTKGIQCEACHGPAEGHRSFAFAVARAGGGNVEASPVVQRPKDADCRGCHNTDSPTWNPERYTKQDGTKDGFDFGQAFKKIAHWNLGE